jgi:N6-L-threonylcarbamoyladenine synthase
MHILALETSCDDTAAAVVEQTPEGVFVRSSVVSSQIALHATYGGVVPNLAAREHARNIVPVVEAALRSAKLTPRDIDLIAVTQGPGLIPALLVGTTAAKTLSFLWHKPLLGIHHIEGAILGQSVFQNHEDIFLDIFFFVLFLFHSVYRQGEAVFHEVFLYLSCLRF